MINSSRSPKINLETKTSESKPNLIQAELNEDKLILKYQGKAMVVSAPKKLAEEKRYKRVLNRVLSRVADPNTYTDFSWKVINVHTPEAIFSTIKTLSGSNNVNLTIKNKINLQKVDAVIVFNPKTDTNTSPYPFQGMVSSPGNKFLVINGQAV